MKIENQFDSAGPMTFKNGAIVHHGAKIIGNVTIDADAVIDAFAFIYSPKGSTISVGRHVHIATHVSISGGDCVLEDFSCVGPGSRLLVASDSFQGDALVGSAVPAKFRNVKRKPITLKRHAIVGANCVIMPGVTIGEGACIGANSLVLHDVVPWTIMGGSPVRLIKYRMQGNIHILEQQLEAEKKAAK